MDKPFLNSYPDQDANFSIYVPQESSYIINFEGNPQSVTVDGKALGVINANSFSEGQNWDSTGPIILRSGNHTVDFNSTFVDKTIIYSSNKSSNSLESINEIFGGGAEPYVLSYSKTDPVSFSVVINASKPFILGYEEPYDDFWQSNSSISKISLNSVNNGFLIENTNNSSTTGTFSINLTYTPEKYLDLGIKVSVLASTFTILAIILIMVSPRILNKHRMSRFQFGDKLNRKEHKQNF
jgi:hypothetical protein